MEPGAVLASARHAGSGDFGETVDVVGDDTGFTFDRLAHLVCPGLGAEDAVAELRVAAEVHALLLRLVHDAEEVGGRCGDGGDAEIAHKHDLTFGVAAGDGKHGAAHALAAVMETESAREESVAVGHLDHVAGADAIHGKAAHRAVLPHGDVILRIGDADGLAGRAARTVETHNLIHRCAAKSHRVFVAQIRLLRERQKLDVGERLDVLGLHAAFLAALAEERHVLVGVFDGPLKTVELKRAERLNGHVVHRRDGMRRRIDVMRQIWIDHVAILLRFQKDAYYTIESLTV